MAQRVLKKSNNRVIAGVCGGIAESLGWQPRQVRSLFVLVALLGGSGLLAYAIFWMVMPPPDASPPDAFDLDDSRKQ